ncbi:MAG: GntR family transcriptional regulator [Phycisphaerales bacterium]|jgi:GntR family transcriptional regulator of arabinose operon|nr:GntR family transcriptional regulator [Phycisphaerales bacterium]
MIGQLEKPSENEIAVETVGKVASARGHLLEAIQRGEYPLGKRIPTEKILADRMGISRNTVREALASLVQDGLLNRRQGSGTYVLKTQLQQQQKKLADVKSVRIGLVLPPSSAPMNSYLQRLIHGMTHVKEGEPAIKVRFLTSDSAYRGPAGVHYLDAIEHRSIDVLLITVFEINQDELDQAIKSKIPIIFCGLSTPRPGIAFVRSNLAAGVARMTNHLLDTGRKRIGLLMNDRVGALRASYLSGVVDAMARRGHDPDLSRIAYWNKHRDRLEVALKSLLDQDADAIMCYDDDAAIEVLSLLKKWNIEVPNSVAVVGANDTAASDGSEFVPLTTLRVHIEEMGAAVRDLAIGAMIRGVVPPRTLDIEPQLIVRDSAPALGQVDA